MGKRQDWETIKLEYMAGYESAEGNIVYPTLEDLAKRHGCSFSQVRKKAAGDKWKEQKEHYQHKKGTLVAEKLVEHYSDKVAGKAAELDVKNLEVADRLLKLVERQIDIIESGESLGVKITAVAALESLSKTQATIQKTTKLCVGEPTDDVNLKGLKSISADIDPKEATDIYLENLKGGNV